MKFLRFLWIITLLMPMVSYAQQIDQEVGEKIYVQPDQIVIESEGIFAYIAGEWTPVELISTDARGLYAMYKNPDLRTWRCLRCNFINSYWNDRCQGPYGDGKCLAPRPQR